MKEADTDNFIQKFRNRFDQSVDALDAGTLSRISRTRYSALEQTRNYRSGPVLWIPATAVVTACVAMFVYSLSPQTTVEENAFIDEIEIISELELYENLEFYEWLDQHEIPS